MLYLEEGEIARLSLKDGLDLKLLKMSPLPHIQELEMNLEAIEKGGYEHFMLKEIFEQPKSIADSIRERLLTSEARLRCKVLWLFG